MIQLALTVLSLGLQLHIFHHDVVDLAQGGAVLQHFPGLVGVEVPHSNSYAEALTPNMIVFGERPFRK